MRVRVIGLGRQTAGDDGAGPAVIAELARRGVPAGVELHQLADPSDLLPLVDGPGRVVIVDAVLGRPAGRVLVLTPEALSAQAMVPSSSHGLGVGQALALAGVLAADAARPEVRLIGITIESPDGPRVGLSPEIALAVIEAADCVLRVVTQPDSA